MFLDVSPYYKHSMWDSVMHLDSLHLYSISPSERVTLFLLNQGLSSVEWLDWSGLFHGQLEYQRTGLGLSVSLQLSHLNALIFSTLQAESRMDWIDQLHCMSSRRLTDSHCCKFRDPDSLSAISGMTVWHNWRLSRYWCGRRGQGCSASLFGTFLIFLHRGCLAPTDRMKGRRSC